MSLFEWSTPERRTGDKILPTVPNEIYLLIIELIAPPGTWSLEPGQENLKLKILSNLSRICRFFANVCLPRIYEFVALYDSAWDYFNSRYTTPALGSILCAQVAKKQPLALGLAKLVKECLVCNARARGDEVFVKRYVAVSSMKNVRKLHFQNCEVEGEWWSMLAALPLLEDLGFDLCKFPPHPTHTELDENIKLEVSRLRVVECGTTGHRQTIAAIDRGSLRALTMDFWAIEEEDWLRQSAITELRLCAVEDAEDSDIEDDSSSNSSESDLDAHYTPELHVALMKAPRSLELLDLTVNANGSMIVDVAESMMQDPAWEDLSSLCSFTLDVQNWIPDMDDSSVGKGIMDNKYEMQRILHNRLGPISTLGNLKYIDYYGTTFYLEDGQWSEGSL